MRDRRIIRLVIGMCLLFTSASATQARERVDFAVEYNALAQNDNGRSASERLHALFGLQWRYELHEYPERGTYQGIEGGNDRWTDMSRGAIDRRRAELSQPMKVLDAIDRGALSVEDQLNYDLFRTGIERRIEGGQFPDELIAVDQMSGVHQSLASMMGVMPTRNTQDFENIIARLEKAPALINQHIALLRTGMDRGITLPAILVRHVPEQVAMLAEMEAQENPILKPFGEFPEVIDAEAQASLRERGHEVFDEEVRPALRRFHRFLLDEYVPAVRETIALSELPDGEAWYAFNVRQRTTTNLTPREIHEIGLREVTRIRAAMKQIITRTGFEGDMAAFNEYLRTDPQFYYEDAASLLAGYRDIAKRADPELTKLFGHLPRSPYGVRAIPAHEEQRRTTAYYQRGSIEAARPGWFYANTYNLPARPKWEMEALTLHEAVPGHHLQISIAQELDELPRFRRNAGYTAYIEGWGLYAESLGLEMGFYEDPYSDYGRLTYEMWRAIRLVVDTGIHALGWSRQRAIDFFMENAAKAEHDVIVEVDRYIAWPGQALAYKIGELKIKELRAYATRELGERFDVRAFHDELLGQGALPLDVLETRMKAWVEREKGE